MCEEGPGNIQSYITWSLSLTWESKKGSAIRTREAYKLLDTSVKKTRVINDSLYLYRLFSFHIYIVYLVSMAYLPSLVNSLVERFGT